MLWVAGKGALASFASFAGVAVGGSRPAAAQVLEDELRIITYETFYGLDPVHEYSAGYMRSVGAAEGLLRITPDGEVDVDLARSYEMVDPTTWRVALRPEVTFWSGQAVDARAVIESLERARQLAPFAANLLKGIKLDAPDEWTVTFRSDGPIPGLPLALANEWLVIHNAQAYGPSDTSFDLGAIDLTGFFRVTAFRPRVQALLERNERYWGVRPRMARVRLDEISDIDARSLAALSGEAHVVRWVTSEGARQIERSRAARLETVRSVGTQNAYLNIQQPPFTDVRVRQALAWAIDREEFVELAFDGRGTPAPSWLATNPAYPEARRVGFPRQDLARAAQLLDEAGWRLPSGGKVRVKDGVPLRFRVLWWGGGKPMAEVVQAHWAKIGAQADVQGSADYGLIESKRAQNDWDVFIEGWGTDGDPAATLGRHVAPDGDLNYMQFRDPRIASLLDGFAALLDAEDRRQQALHVNERQAELVPFIPLAARDRLNAVHRNVRNYITHFLNYQYEVHPDLWVAA